MKWQLQDDKFDDWQLQDVKTDELQVKDNVGNERQRWCTEEYTVDASVAEFGYAPYVLGNLDDRSRPSIFPFHRLRKNVRR